MALDLSDHELLLRTADRVIKRLEDIESALRTIDITLDRIAGALEATGEGRDG